MKTFEQMEGAFELSETGVFMQRSGTARLENDSCSNRKLCIVATDKNELIRLLYKLSEREDCFFIKLSIKPRDGMYLGRFFLMTDEAAGMLWSELKPHPKFLTSIQDDDFTSLFRDK